MRRRLSPVLQHEASECGLACLAMVAQQRGGKTSLSDLRRRYPTSIKGTTLRELALVATQMGFTARPLRLTLKELDLLKKPAILHWRFRHFIVLEAVDRNGYKIIDPAIGARHIDKHEMTEAFTGIALELGTTTQFQPTPILSLQLKDFFRHAHGLMPALLKLGVLSLAIQCAALSLPLLTQFIVDQVIPSRDQNLLLLLILGFGCLVVVNTLLTALRGWSLVMLTSNLRHTWGSNLCRHLLKLPLDYFEKRHTGDVVSRFTALGAVERLVTGASVEATIDGVLVVFSLVVMWLYAPVLTAIVVAGVGFYGLVTWAFLSTQRQRTQEMLVASAREHSHFVESLRNMATLRVNHGEDARFGHWQNRLVEKIRGDVNLRLVGLYRNLLGQLGAGLEYLLLLYFAAGEIMNQRMSIGMLMAFLAYRTQFASRGAALVDNLLEYRLAGVHLDRLSDITHQEQEQLHDPLAADRALVGHLSVKDVVFRYAPTLPMVVANVSFEVGPGESVALVAPSGFGKTTLLKLLLGLLQPSSGAVYIDHLSLATFGLSNYRRQIGAVLQNDGLFAGSLLDNIALFEPEPDIQRAIECCEATLIDGDIRAMPMGYHSLVGDMGTAISGGQVQRVMLARALYKRPRMLFLDEATSHLDKPTADVIEDNLSHLAITRVLISHRRETRSRVDRVIDLSRQAAAA